MSASLQEKLDKFVALRDTATPNLSSVTLALREKTVRRSLKIKKKQPLEYKGLAIRCIGSLKWRYEHEGETA